MQRARARAPQRASDSGIPERVAPVATVPSYHHGRCAPSTPVAKFDPAPPAPFFCIIYLDTPNTGLTCGIHPPPSLREARLKGQPTQLAYGERSLGAVR